MTNNSIDSNIPIEITKGGTNASALSLTYGVVYYDGSKISTVSSLGASGQVLTSNGSSPPTFKGSVSAVSSIFAASLSGDVVTTTGSGSSYTMICDSEGFDVGGDYDSSTGVFTAPETNHYFLCTTPIVLGGLGSSVEVSIVTSNRSYLLAGYVTAWAPVTNDRMCKHLSTLADMDAGDTAFVSIAVYDSPIPKATLLKEFLPTGFGAGTVFEGFILGT